MPGVDNLRIPESQFLSARQNVIDKFYALHKRMIHISDFIAPRAESSPRVNALVFKLIQYGKKRAVPVQAWGRIAFGDKMIPCMMNLFPVRQQTRIQRAVNHIFNHPFLFHFLHGTFAHFAHQRPVIFYIGNIVRGVIAEHRNPVKRAVVFGKIHPAFACQIIARISPERKPHNVSGGIFEGSGFGVRGSG